MASATIVAVGLIAYLSRFLERYGEHYERVLLFNEERRWGKSLVEACKDVRRKLKVIQL